VTTSQGPAGAFPLRNHDVGPGLLAWAHPPRPDGTFNVDRDKRDIVTRVRVRALEQTAPARPDGISEADWRWITREPHRWPTIVRRFPETAEALTRALTLGCCIEAEHAYANGVVVDPPLSWIPHPDLISAQEDRRAQRRSQDATGREHADELAERLAADYPGAADALRTVSGPTLLWLARAATDLLEERTHDGPRAFAQAHAGHTKAREDLPRLLLDAGFEPRALEALGVARNPYIGLGGPLRARLGDRILDFTGWPGPHDLRLPPTAAVSLHVRPRTETLLVIENRQAAEHVCDQHPDIAVIWCHGQPAETVLNLISQAARGVARTLICLDADLGGIRIAARIHDHLPDAAPREILDVGAYRHVQGADFSPQTRHYIQELVGRRDSVAAFAAACLARGYAVEQEASIRAAVAAALR
jgi:hypothetical protein